MQTMTNNYRPSKYDGKTFEEALALAKGLERKLLEYFLKYGFAARWNDDLNPFLFPNKQSVRGLDVFCFKNGFSFFIDAKDYPRLKYHPATGIPMYLYKRYKKIQTESGIKTMIFFQDYDLREKDKPVGNPYGGFMDNFKKYKKQDIKHRGTNRKGEVFWCDQIIWRCDSMMEIESFLKYDFWNEFERTTEPAYDSVVPF